MVDKTQSDNQIKQDNQVEASKKNKSLKTLLKEIEKKTVQTVL